MNVNSEGKNNWVSYFISRRDSRREDMRQYFNILCVCLFSLFGSGVVLVLAFFANTPLYILFILFAISCFILVAFVRYFYNEYRLAEKDVKNYTDAI